MLIVFDPNRDAQQQTTAVRRVLGLTDAEARLACALFTGITLREAAERLSLSVNTCKSELKSIYAKTGSRSHVDLAKAVLFAALSAPRLSCEIHRARDTLEASMTAELSLHDGAK
jgi:DNA-binding CsgD family transcriptional regulator